MNLRQAILQVRYGLDEITPALWTDVEIIAWLNEGAQLMNSLAQVLIGVQKIPSVIGKQEYVLNEDCDEIDSVAYFNGTLLRPIPTQQAAVQVGTSTLGIPVSFYLRTVTLQFMDQDPNGGDINVTQIPQGVARKPRMVIGLAPIPSVAGQMLTVSYFARHYQMFLDDDESAIPQEFQRGYIDFAIAKGKEKEAAYAEADKKMASFKDYSSRLQEKWQNAGSEVGFPRMKVRGLSNGMDRNLGGTSWVFVGDASYE